jgi:hypothetical protein
VQLTVNALAERLIVTVVEFVCLVEVVLSVTVTVTL